MPSANRLCKIAKGLSFQTMLLAAMCSVSALVLSGINPFMNVEKMWRSLSVGCAMTGALFHYENVYFEQDFHFPIIQTTKYSMFMAKLLDTIVKSMKKSFHYVLFISFPLYIIEPETCNSTYFFVLLWFSISFILYLFYSFEHIVYLIMTERVIFPIVTLKQDECLLDALNDENKILRSLALYDLYQATINETKRRKEIFNLSFAGNVPQSWKIIFNFCINNIKRTIEDMTSSVKLIPPKLINRRNIPNARLIQTNGIDGKRDEENKCKQSNLCSIFEKFHMYNYFFGPLDKEKTLEEFEITVWCCYILSYLATVSLEEDEYGVVREQLGQIISTILDLKSQLELQSKNFNFQKSKKTEYLTIHVKTCAILLAFNFSAYANDIGLDKTHLHSFHKLISFLKY